MVVQSVDCLTLDSSSGLRIVGSSPRSGSTQSMEPAWDSLSLSLCPSPLFACALFLRIQKIKKNRFMVINMYFLKIKGNHCNQ